MPVLRKGPRGGKYHVKNGRRVYVKRGAAKTTTTKGRRRPQKKTTKRRKRNTRKRGACAARTTKRSCVSNANCSYNQRSKKCSTRRGTAVRYGPAFPAV